MNTSSTLYFLLGDPDLAQQDSGSTSIVRTDTGVKYSESHYMPWGDDRYTSITPPTAYLYTEQKLE